MTPIGMKILALLLLPLVIIGCSADSPTPQQTSTAALTDIPDVPAYALGTPVSYGALTVLPVLAKDRQQLKGDYATLAEAKKNGWVEIVERPGYGEVNRLLVRNTGPRDLLLLGGELLIGGKQDRIVAHDTIVPAGKEVDVDVYCVENGRWEGSSTKFEDGGAMAPQSVRESATYEDQNRVWDKVAGFRANAKAPMDSGTTIRGGLDQREVKQKVDRGLDALRASLGKMDNVVGIVIVRGGAPQSLELFGDARLFAAARDPLLKSYLAEAAVNTPSPRGGVRNLPSWGRSPEARGGVTGAEGAGGGESLNKACATFVTDVLTSRRRLRATENGGQVFDLAASAGAGGKAMKGRELADKDYEAQPAKASSGLIHGTYRR